MSNTFTVGIIEFPNPLFCSSEVMGKKIEISIQGIPGVLIFPSLPQWTEKEEDPLNMRLTPPDSVKTWKQGEELIFWGRPRSYPSGDSNIEKAIFEFYIPQDHSEEILQKIYNGFNMWIHLFDLYIKLLTNQNTSNKIEIHNAYENNLTLYVPTYDGLNSILKSSIPIITIHMFSEISLNMEKILESCRLASLGLSPRLEYKLLLEAYKARLNEDYRKAIIEAASALEISLSNKIKKQFIENNINYGDKLMKKYRMLGGLFELSQIIGIQLPTTDYKTSILEPRNEVVHDARFHNKEVAQKVISEVERYLKEFSPMLVDEV